MILPKVNIQRILKKMRRNEVVGLGRLPLALVAPRTGEMPRLKLAGVLFQLSSGTLGSCVRDSVRLAG
jgi:hypothetical protein